MTGPDDNVVPIRAADGDDDDIELLDQDHAYARLWHRATTALTVATAALLLSAVAVLIAVL